MGKSKQSQFGLAACFVTTGKSAIIRTAGTVSGCVRDRLAAPFHPRRKKGNHYLSHSSEIIQTLGPAVYILPFFTEKVKRREKIVDSEKKGGRGGGGAKKGLGGAGMN